MDYIVRHETKTYLRLRLRSGRFSAAQGDILEYALTNLKGVTDVKLYPASGGIVIYHGGNREEILRKMRALQFHNVEMFAKELEDTIDQEELARRKLSPGLKRSLRRKVLMETAADVLMPMPLQVGYHIYQLVTLRNL